jgi:YidC/Oxa1 family membrane protein insertase
MIATSGIVHAFGSVFQPIFDFIGLILATIYSVVPNYGVAIIILTILIMGILTPFTVKSTKSMIAMQRIQPELKKLQQKYKGPENRQILNEELMRLYREEGVNPLSSCVPMLLQMPVLIMMYGVIRGLVNVTKAGKPEPRYLPKSSLLYHNLLHADGKLNAFGLDLSLKPFAHHAQWYGAIPYVVLALAAIGMQYFQMWQINNRNKKTGTAVPSQQQTMMRVMPIMMGFIYIVLPAATTIYMITSSTIRILTQDIMFRMGVSDPTHERNRREKAIPARADADAPETKNDAKSNPQPSKKAPHPRSKTKRQRKDR